MFFTAVLLVGGAGIVFGQSRGDREDGAPPVVLALVPAAVVALDGVALAGLPSVLRVGGGQLDASVLVQYEAWVVCDLPGMPV